MKIEKTKTSVVKALLKKIKEQSFISRNGVEMTVISVYTDVGKFTNFKSIWEKQNIDVDKLSEDDWLEIVYSECENAVTGKTYKNFQEIRVLMRDDEI